MLPHESLSNSRIRSANLNALHFTKVSLHGCPLVLLWESAGAVVVQATQLQLTAARVPFLCHLAKERARVTRVVLREHCGVGSLHRLVKAFAADFLRRFAARPWRAVLRHLCEEVEAACCTFVRPGQRPVNWASAEFAPGSVRRVCGQWLWHCRKCLSCRKHRWS